MNLRMLSAYQGMVPGGLRRLVRAQIATNRLLSRDIRRKLGHSFPRGAKNRSNRFTSTTFIRRSRPKNARNCLKMADGGVR